MEKEIFLNNCKVNSLLFIIEGLKDLKEHINFVVFIDLFLNILKSYLPTFLMNYIEMFGLLCEFLDSNLPSDNFSFLIELNVTNICF